MTLSEKARLLHEPRGRAVPRDEDLLRWLEVLPGAAPLVEEVQYLRRNGATTIFPR